MNELPYREIPEAPLAYNAGHLAGRMLDGMGYRYYWATEGITTEALSYRPSEDGRSTWETLLHICDLTEGIRYVAEGKTIDKRFDFDYLDMASLRAHTLHNIEVASRLLKDSSDTLDKMEMKYLSGNKIHRFPFWNVVNGPISDAIYHIGQVVSFRRSAGCPINAGTNPFLGRTSPLL